MFWYYKITYASSEKYVKTSNESCEVWLKSPFGNKYEKFDKVYPSWDEACCTQLSEEEFMQAIGTIDINTDTQRPINQNHRFNLNKKAI